MRTRGPRCSSTSPTAATTSGAPAVGDTVGSDGTDPLFPEGDWDVVGRQWVYGLRGLETIYCEIRRAP